MKNSQFQISKLDAARRQLHVAIRLLFDDADPVAVHTLVGAASSIISDLVEQQHPEKSWDKVAQEENKITAAEYFKVMRKAQNFLKHASDDASSTLDFNSLDTEFLAFWAVMNLGSFGLLSIEESVFQLWFLACHPLTPNPIIEPYKTAIDLFGDLSKESRAIRLSVGQRVLAEQLADPLGD